MKAMKTVKHLPGPPSYPILGSVLALNKDAAPKMTNLHGAIQKYYEEYGPIFKTSAFGKTQVWICKPDWFRQIILADGKYPRRGGAAALDKYFSTSKRQVNIIASGEPWYQDRVLLNEPFFNKDQVSGLKKPIHELTQEFADRLKRDREPDGTVRTLGPLTANVGMQTVAILMLGKKVQDEVALKKMADAFGAAGQILEQIRAVPIQIAQYTKAYKTMCAKFDEFHDIGEEIFSKEKPSTEEFALIDYIKEQGLPPERAMDTMIGFTAVGAQTTSNAIQWCLYELSQNPDVQQKIRDEYYEYAATLDSNEDVDVRKLGYLDNAIREVHRMHSAGAIIRRLLNKEITLGDYTLPIDTDCFTNLHVMGNDPKIFDDAHVYDPDRWDIEDKDKLRDMKYAVQPFGTGARKCLGERYAKMELAYVVLDTILNFEVEWDGKVLNGILKFSFEPESPPTLKFHDVAKK